MIIIRTGLLIYNMVEEKYQNQVIKVDKEIKTISCPYINDSSWDSHPKIYLNFGKNSSVKCPYCGKTYQK